MTDREEFEKFGDWVKKEPFYDDLSGAEKSIAKRAWQARGELDAVRIKEYEVIDKGQLERIKELEAKIKVAEESELLALRNNDRLRVQINELTAKLDKAKKEDEANERWLAQLASECSDPNQ